jgi:hypothetical protein
VLAKNSQKNSSKSFLQTMNFGDGRRPTNSKALEMLMEITNDFFFQITFVTKASSLPFQGISKKSKNKQINHIFSRFQLGNLSCDGNKSSWWWRS